VKYSRYLDLKKKRVVESGMEGKAGMTGVVERSPPELPLGNRQKDPRLIV
jgi:hypothetical protein